MMISDIVVPSIHIQEHILTKSATNIFKPFRCLCYNNQNQYLIDNWRSFMTINEFIEKFAEEYDSDYEYEWDEDLRQLTLISNEKSDTTLSITIDLEENSYDIYREFLYEECYGQSVALEIIKEEMFFYECIKRSSEQLPQISYDDGMGCPFCCDSVGYFNLPLIWSDFIHLLSMFEQACQQMNLLTIDEIDKESDLFLSYKEMQSNVFKELKGLSASLCDVHIKDMPHNKNHCFDSVFAYVNTSKTVLTGVGLEHLSQIYGQIADKNYRFYAGIQYFIICAEFENDLVTIVNKRFIDEVTELFEQVNGGWDIDSFIHYSLNERSWLVVTCGELWAVIRPIKSERHEACFTFEKNKIKSLEHDFILVAPEHLWSRTYDFSILNDNDFENMCRDLLLEMDFRNIQVRGKTRAPDGGVDITADEEYKTLIGTEKRKWIFQCKHTKGQIDRKDLSEVRDLLQEFHADCYGLFFSGYFTPNTLDRIERICQNDKLKIQGWDFNGLEILLTKFPKVSTKYFGL